MRMTHSPLDLSRFPPLLFASLLRILLLAKSAVLVDLGSSAAAAENILPKESEALRRAAV